MYRYIICFLMFCHPVFSENWQKVYLATYPRSGNHWARYLIEEASGIATSSIYCDFDPPHLPEIFPWGAYSPFQGYEGNRRYPHAGETVVIKTHQRSGLEHPDYSSAIRIVRNPVDSFYSLYVYACKNANIEPDYMIPREFLLRFITEWKIFHTFWNLKRNVLTIKYEDMLEDPKHYLELMLKKCGYDYSEETLLSAVIKYPAEGKPFKHIAHFSSQDLLLIKSQLRNLIRLFGYEIPLK